MSLFIADAVAATTHAASHSMRGEPMFGSFFILIAFLLIFYMLLWRPQNKRIKAHRQLIANLQKGDEVITNGGILGKVVKVSEEFVILNIAEGIDIKLQKPAVSSVVPKGTVQSV